MGGLNWDILFRSPVFSSPNSGGGEGESIPPVQKTGLATWRAREEELRLFLILLAVALWSCGGSFEPIGLGGGAPTTTGNGGQGGGSTTGAGGGPTSTASGSGGSDDDAGTTGGGGAGGGNPCPPITLAELDMMLGQSCQGLGCDENASRIQAVAGVIKLVPPEKLQGYQEPTAPSFLDVPFGSWHSPWVEQAVWLGLLIQPGGNFDPDLPATTCFAQDVVDRWSTLPGVFAIIESVEADTVFSKNAGPQTTVTYLVYGTSSASRLTMARVVNNLVGEFSAPQETEALEAVDLHCEGPQPGNFTPYTLPLIGGKADFSGLDCFMQSGGPMKIRFQVDPAPSGAGWKARVGFDPSILAVRGWPVAQGGLVPPLVTVQ